MSFDILLINCWNGKSINYWERSERSLNRCSSLACTFNIRKVQNLNPLKLFNFCECVRLCNWYFSRTWPLKNLSYGIGLPTPFYSLAVYPSCGNTFSPALARWRNANDFAPVLTPYWDSLVALEPCFLRGHGCDATTARVRTVCARPWLNVKNRMKRRLEPYQIADGSISTGHSVIAQCPKPSLWGSAIGDRSSILMERPILEVVQLKEQKEYVDKHWAVMFSIKC
jgi:hypothetical protein